MPNAPDSDVAASSKRLAQLKAIGGDEVARRITAADYTPSAESLATSSAFSQHLVDEAKRDNERRGYAAEADEREFALNARKWFSLGAFGLTVIWIAAVMGVVIADGCNYVPEALVTDELRPHFEVSDTVIVALVAGLSAGVLGLGAAVIGWLFPRG